MDRYIVNYRVSGYDTIELTTDKKFNAGDIVVIVADKEFSLELKEAYKAVTNLLASGVRVIFLDINNEVPYKKLIMMLMATYHRYDMYTLESKIQISENYLHTIEDRDPDIIEVQQYIGGDITAYSDATTMLFGITTLCREGNLEGLKTFVEDHYETIVNSYEVVEYLRRVADKSNSAELLDYLDKLRGEVSKANKDREDMKKEIRQLRTDNQKLAETAEDMKKSANANAKRVSDLESELENSGNKTALTSYKEINTARISCKAKQILYFKEITYARYTNSLVMSLFNFLNEMHNKEKNVKLMIYDSAVGVPAMYDGLSILSTREYLNARDKIVKSTSKYVISEPNQTYLEDVLRCISPVFDVVIVYDRLHQEQDIVSGNNVTKIFVVNSASNFKVVASRLKITANHLIISSEPLGAGNNSLIIPEIADYDTKTGSSKMSKYLKALSPLSGEKIIHTIVQKAKIPTILDEK